MLKAKLQWNANYEPYIICPNCGKMLFIGLSINLSTDKVEQIIFCIKCNTEIVLVSSKYTHFELAITKALEEIGQLNMHEVKNKTGDHIVLIGQLKELEDLILGLENSIEILERKEYELVPYKGPGVTKHGVTTK